MPNSHTQQNKHWQQHHVPNAKTPNNNNHNNNHNKQDIVTKCHRCERSIVQPHCMHVPFRQTHNNHNNEMHHMTPMCDDSCVQMNVEQIKTTPLNSLIAICPCQSAITNTKSKKHHKIWANAGLTNNKTNNKMNNLE